MTKALIITCLSLAPGISSAHHSPANFDLDVTDFSDDGRSLINDLVITDPVMYSEPLVLRQAYARALPDTRMLEYECTEGMWLDHEAARERRQARQ
jgi:hypothetical protein